MSKYLHRTSRSGSSAPSSSDIDVGEIGIGASTLGSPTSGFNNGRLYIKLDNGDIKRFIGLGLPGTTDAAFKMKYGGTNNTFSSVSAPSNALGNALTYFSYSSAGNHAIDKTANDSLTWDASNNRLKVGPPSATAPLATLDVNGNVRIHSVTTFSSVFNSNFSILGWNSNDYNLYAIPSLSLISYISDSSLPPSKISGVITTTKGGTGVDLSALSLSEGNIFFYNSIATRFDVTSSLKWNNSYNRLSVSGQIEYTAPVDGSNNATPLGLDSSNKIVTLTSNNIYNSSFKTIQIGAQTIEADSNTDTLTFEAGSGIQLGVNSSTDTITISVTGISGGGSGPVDLDELTDVEISAPASGQILRYNGAGWINGFGGVSIPGVTVSGFANTTFTLFSNTCTKYQFIEPSGSPSTKEFILSASGALEGHEFFIKNLSPSVFTINVYHDNNSNLLASLTGDYDFFGSFVFDGAEWRHCFSAGATP